MAKENRAPETEEPEDAAVKPEDEAAEEAEIAEDEPTIEELIAAEQEKYLRLAAEYDNYRKRSQKEREAIFRDVKADTIIKLLPVYDNLERAVKAETADEAFKKGVEMTMAQLNSIFEDLGVKPIIALGEKFDASLHNAVMHIDDEAYGENEIVEEFQKGFTLGDKVIRFSMVKVAN